MAEEPMWRHTFDKVLSIAVIRGAGHCCMLKMEMEFVEECCVFALVYEPSMKIDTSLPQIFQKKTKAVSIRCMVYYALIFEVPS
jgi:hypothetical protein